MSSDLMAKAINLLARREHSRFDLGRKLKRYTQDQGEIEQTLDALEARDFLSDKRFAEVFIRSRKERFGIQRLRYELNQHQIQSMVIESVLAPLEQTELQRAIKVWQRKFGQYASDQREYARQYRFLGQRGFRADVIRKVLSESTH